MTARLSRPRLTPRFPWRRPLVVSASVPAFLGTLLACADPVSAADLERHPYLQRASETEMTVAWTTLAASSGEVRYGSSPDALTEVVTSAGSGTAHEVRITGLSPDTRYYYEVRGDGEVLAGGDEAHFFVTHPAEGTRPKFRFWVVGDSGTGNSNQAAVRDAMVDYAGQTQPDFYVHVGDMAYDDGTYAEFTTNFFAPYEDILRNTVVWPALGNHEGHSADSATESGPYYGAYVLPRQGESGGVPSGTEAYYSVDYANVHLIALDSYDSDRSPSGPMLTWLAADLEATTAEWIVAFWHHPPYTKGSHDSDTEGALVDMRENALPILEAGGVDLVLGGHSHIYERSFLLNGAYQTPSTTVGILDASDGKILGDGPYQKDPNATAGAVYVVAGHGGTGISGTANHPLMYFSELARGSVLVDVQENRLTMTNVRFDGTVTDEATLIKGAGIVVASPDGGEGLMAGGSTPIRWWSTGDIPTVDIAYSCNGGDDWNTLAAGVENTGSWDWAIPMVGTNIALVRVSSSDQTYADESDGMFSIGASASSNVIAFGDSWRYSDGQGDPGPNWMQPAFDDSSWATGNGQFGYGDGDEATTLMDLTPNIPTVYFRKTFTLNEAVSGGSLDAIYDDALAVWINGTLVLEENLQNGLAHDAYGGATSSDNSSTSSAWADMGPLVVGENTIAVLVKQEGPDSSDLSFDLSLSVEQDGPGVGPCADGGGDEGGSGDADAGETTADGSGSATSGEAGETAGAGTADGTADETDASTGSNANGDGGGCSCTSGADAKGSSPSAWGLLGFGLLGLRRRRRTQNLS